MKTRKARLQSLDHAIVAVGLCWGGMIALALIAALFESFE